MILALWKRINRPNLILNSKVKDFIWEIICAIDDIGCYILNKPRPELIIRDEPDTSEIIKGKVDNKVIFK